MVKDMSKVSIVRCKDYDDYNKVYSSVKKSIELIGMMERVVKPGDKVLVKPNLLSAKSPEKGVTTHPSLVKAVIQLVKELGGKPFIGDSSFEMLFRNNTSEMQKIAKVTGMKKIADEMDVEFIGFKDSAAVNTPKECLFKNLEIARDALEADVVINLPKLKTHSQMIMTLSVKNMFGCVVGNRKMQWHFKAGIDISYFGKMLVDIYYTIKPILSIVDGIVGLEGNGPGASGIPRNMGLIIAGNDCIAIDTVICEIVGLKVDELPTNKAAIDGGIGVSDISDIEILGEDIKGIKVNDFVFPETVELRFGPRFLTNTIRNSISHKPIEDKKRCTLCGSCVAVCPVQIIKIGKTRLYFEYDRCIRCYCCIEVCPEGAMRTKKGYLTGLIERG
ncbi:MAG: DUF362 domain-containing protein [Nitrospirota bacterium]